jgi:trimeric autotransporter adhesin
MGIGATTYTPSTNGATQFRAANTTDRLFVIGNAIDTNNNDLVDAAERSDALIVLKNGLTRLPSTTNAMITSADGKAVVTKEYLQSNNWSLTGNTGTNAATNFIGTTDNIDLVFRRGNIISGRLGDSNTFFGRNSGVVNTGTSNTFIGERAGIANVSGSANTFLGRLAGANGASGNDNIYLGYAAGLNNTGNGNLMLGAFSSQNTTGSFNVFLGYSAGSNNTTGARNTTIGNQSDLGAANLTNATAIGNLAQVDTSNSLVLGSINGVNGSLVSTNVGIGTTSPLTRLDIVDENTTTSNLVYGNLHVRSNNAQNIDIGGAITLGGYNDDTMVQPRVFGSVEGRKSNATTNSSSGYLSFKTNNAGTLAERMRITNAGSVGIGTTTPGGLFELSLDQGRKPGTNTWTVVSDQRLKTINGNYTKGLNEILQLNPIRFNYKNNGERTFEKEVLDTEFPGFIAQEVQPLFPDAVGTDADGFLNFNIHPILIASVNAIKELNAKNTSLQAENEALKTELNEQKAVLESVLQRLSALEKE